MFNLLLFLIWLFLLFFNHTYIKDNLLNDPLKTMSIGIINVVAQNAGNNLQSFLNFKAVFVKIVIFDQTYDNHGICFIFHTVKLLTYLLLMSFIDFLCPLQFFSHNNYGIFPFNDNFFIVWYELFGRFKVLFRLVALYLCLYVFFNGNELIHDGLNDFIRLIVEKIYWVTEISHHHKFS